MGCNDISDTRLCHVIWPTSWWARQTLSVGEMLNGAPFAVASTVVKMQY